MKQTHVMIDIETLGTQPGSVILSIGAVVIGSPDLSFYARIDPESSVAHGFKLDVRTVMWWMRQSDEARKALTEGAEYDVVEALDMLTDWFATLGTVDGVWGNGATFDNVLLQSAYDLCGLPRPWGHREDRCFRTIRALVPVPTELIPLNGVAHNALDDAKWQAEYLLAAAPWAVEGDAK